MKKAAIVIGINSTGELPVLKSAASGARHVGTWLDNEGFEVKYLLDDDGPVTVTSITKALNPLIAAENLTQLVIYFSGHGFLNNYSEFWMLSEAPHNPNEAISVRESVELARSCGIPNVVIVSDACRSTPQTLHAERVRGSLIFPNEDLSCAASPEIDRYFAALPGDPALEMVVNESVQKHEGVFTHCFLRAYTEPDAEMIRQVKSNGETINVVPNRCLKEYLRRNVPALMQAKGIMVRQVPDAVVESGESVYMGQFRTDKKMELAPQRETLGIRDVAKIRLAEAAGLDSRFTASVPLYAFRSEGREALKKVAHQTDFDESVERIKHAQTMGAGHFETGTGFQVFGAQVFEAVGLNMLAELGSSGNGEDPAYVRLYPANAHVASIALRFANGSGTVLAGLEGYIGKVVVENGRVMNVSYVPSDNSYRWGEYVEKKDLLDKLRAITATAARFGVFRVNRESARTIAGQIRFLKGVDPTLGLYAAYAYAEVGLIDQVKSVLDYMVSDLNAVLFDVAMLAGECGGRRRTYEKIIPFCPMLSQGWNLLRVKRAEVPSVVSEAEKYLLPALWTTFESAGMDAIFKGIREGSIS